ncbi:MAG: SDR family oxidoreductase [Oceanospirillaceae bacterium]|nr:SDR family oxidoreductase [Oceanospirillaceae bacterium]
MPEEQLNEFPQAIQSKIPLQRFGQPEEIAKLITFLTSNDAAFITGSEYNIDGGLNLNTIV